MDKYEEFKKDIYNLTKIDLNAYKEQQMKRRIDSLIGKRKCKSYKDYVQMIKTDKEAFEEFVGFLTINVSEFYRNPEQWKLFVDEFMPELMKKFGRRLKVWSAACSTGDEPYSLVMAMSKHLDLSQIKIIATDIDKQILEQAKVGLYNEKSIAHVPDEYKKKYFTKIGRSYQIDEKIKKCVEFRQHNLLRDEYIKDCDLIVCRNVLIYFTDDAKYEVYGKFADSLKKNGILFIGNTEQIINYATLGYKRRYSFYYEKEKNKNEL